MFSIHSISGNEMERKKWFVQLSMISSDNSQDREKELPLYSQLPVSTFTFSLSIFFKNVPYSIT
jgi:hypothetical protein